MAQRYCKNCGSRVEKNSIYCPECSIRLTKDNTTTNLQRKKTKVLPIIAVILIVLSAALYGLVYFGGINIDKAISFIKGNSAYKTEDNIKDKTETEHFSDTADLEETDTPDSTDTPENPDQEAAPYNVIHKAGFAGQQILPISCLGYSDRYITSLELNILESADKSSYSLMDYSGNIVCSYDFPEAPYLDNLGDRLGNMSYGFVDDTTMEFFPSEGGHGFLDIRLCYIESTGEIVESFPGGLGSVNYDIDYAVVQLLTESESDYGYSYNGINYDFQMKYGIVVDSKLVVSCEYEASTGFQEGICALRRNGKWGYFNSRGEQILDFEYTPGYNINCDHSNTTYCRCTPYPSTYGYIPVCKDGKWAYADTSGLFVTDFEFEHALPVHRGNSWVKQDGEWMVIELTSYSDYITEEDAKLILDEYIGKFQGTTNNTLSGLYNEKAFTFYLTTGYCFETVDQAKFIVLYNGEVYRLV